VTDEITLVVPAQEDFHQIALLVMGGLGARLDLTYEDLDDLQTALATLLDRRDDDEAITIAISPVDGGVRTTVGPFSGSELAELESDSTALGLRRVLETVADEFEIERRDGSEWCVISKRTSAPAGAAG
jgi:anti-sigma regulatory factor (Ser/Thr protein kinase)